MKNDLSDPAIEDLMTCYGEYRTSDFLDYLKSVYNNSSVPDSLRKHLQWLYEDHFGNDFPRLTVDIINSNFQMNSKLLVRLRCKIENTTNRPFVFSMDSLFCHMDIHIKLTENKGNPEEQRYIESDIPQKELFLSDVNVLTSLDSNITLTPGKNSELVFFFDAEKFIQKKQQAWYGIDVHGSWFLPNLTDLPLTIHEFSSSLTLY